MPCHLQNNSPAARGWEEECTQQDSANDHQIGVADLLLSNHLSGDAEQSPLRERTYRLQPQPAVSLASIINFGVIPAPIDPTLIGATPDVSHLALVLRIIRVTFQASLNNVALMINIVERLKANGRKR